MPVPQRVPTHEARIAPYTNFRPLKSPSVNGDGALEASGGLSEAVDGYNLLADYRRLEDLFQREAEINTRQESLLKRQEDMLQRQEAAYDDLKERYEALLEERRAEPKSEPEEHAPHIDLSLSKPSLPPSKVPATSSASANKPAAAAIPPADPPSAHGASAAPDSRPTDTPMLATDSRLRPNVKPTAGAVLDRELQPVTESKLSPLARNGFTPIAHSQPAAVDAIHPKPNAVNIPIGPAIERKRPPSDPFVIPPSARSYPESQGNAGQQRDRQSDATPLLKLPQPDVYRADRHVTLAAMRHFLDSCERTWKVGRATGKYSDRRLVEICASSLQGDIEKEWKTHVEQNRDEAYTPERFARFIQISCDPLGRKANDNIQDWRACRQWPQETAESFLRRIRRISKGLNPKQLERLNESESMIRDKFLSNMTRDYAWYLGQLGKLEESRLGDLDLSRELDRLNTAKDLRR